MPPIIVFFISLSSKDSNELQFYYMYRFELAVFELTSLCYKGDSNKSYDHIKISRAYKNVLVTLNWSENISVFVR